MNEYPYNLCRRVVPTVAAAILIQTFGCAGSVTKSDADVAHQSLVKALDTWKAGQTADDLKQQNPEIIVGDLDWQHGHKLVHYAVDGTGLFDGRNLRVPVRLMLHQRRQKPRVFKTSYIVSTNPVITVIREAE